MKMAMTVKRMKVTVYAWTNEKGELQSATYVAGDDEDEARKVLEAAYPGVTVRRLIRAATKEVLIGEESGEEGEGE